MSAEERAAKTAMSCSAPSCSKNCASTGVGCGEKPATGSFPATVGIRRITPSTQKRYTTPAEVYTAHPLGTLGTTEQKAHLGPVAPGQCPNTSGGCSRSQTPRRGNWFLQCAAQLESEAPSPPPCPLRHSRWRVESRSHPLGEIT